jgi:hypothetical protein
LGASTNCLISDGQQFHKYQQNETTTSHFKPSNNKEKKEKENDHDVWL